MLKTHLLGVPPLVCSLLWPKETLQPHERPRCSLGMEVSKEIWLLLWAAGKTPQVDSAAGLETLVVDVGWRLLKWELAQMYLYPSISKDTPEIFRKNVLNRNCSNSRSWTQASFALWDCVITGNAEQKPVTIKGEKVLQKVNIWHSNYFLVYCPNSCKTSI